MDKVVKERSNLQFLFAKGVLKVGVISTKFLVLQNIYKIFFFNKNDVSCCKHQVLKEQK